MLCQAPIVLEKLRDRESTYLELQVNCRSVLNAKLLVLLPFTSVCGPGFQPLPIYFSGAQERMASPEVSSNPTEFQKVARAAADLEQTVTAYREYEQLQQELAEAKELAAESAGVSLQPNKLSSCTAHAAL
jgi:hypothetical protein